ncbi:hypothetical protein ACB092_08G026900 [Castanea dentata]
MAKQATTLFLEEWLRSVSGCSSNVNSTNSSSSSARAIIQVWAELRDSLQNQSFHTHHLQSLKTLLNSQTSLHVADPQAKIVLSLLSSPCTSLPNESCPLFLRLLYIWVRKSFRPSLILINSAVEVFSHLFSAQFDSRKCPLLLSEGVLLLGAFAFVPSLSEGSKTVCLDMLCRLLEEEYQLIGSYGELISDVLAGIGYALSSSVNVHYVRILDSLLGIWGKEGGPCGSITHGLMILHLVEWVLSSLIDFRCFEKIIVFACESLEISKANYVPFAIVMSAAGVLRVLNRSKTNGLGLETVSKLRGSAEDRVECFARDIISRSGVMNADNDPTCSLLLQCISLALARSGPVSSCAPLLVCLASALLTEIFPLRHLYTKVRDFSHRNSARLGHDEVKKHLESVLFKEAGAITSVFCNQYVSVDVESEGVVENLIWDYCQDIYLGHRQVVLMLRGKENELVGDMEKIAESAFLMVVLFALTVTKHKFNSKSTQETQWDVSVRILVSFSCLEYFRRIRLPEYMGTIRGVIVSVQENESACVSFVESMPSYMDMANGTIAQASHSMFAAFMSSGKDLVQDERLSLKEQLGYPAITPFEGMASGVAALVRNLPAGSPAIFYCIHSLVEKGSTLCGDIFAQEVDLLRNRQGDSDACKKILELLLWLISLVDIQVLPNLMKLLAQLIIQLPKDGQKMVLHELYSQVAESDDVTRKLTLVSWLQSLSYLCAQATSGSAASKGVQKEVNMTSARSTDSLSLTRLNARL